MNSKIIQACCVVVAVCFIVIAYSQYQSQRAQWQFVEAQRLLVSAKILDVSPTPVLKAEYRRAEDKGWRPRDILLYIFDGTVIDPLIQAQLAKEAEEATAWMQQLLEKDAEHKP
jgi:hypothetical protein